MTQLEENKRVRRKKGESPELDREGRRKEICVCV